MTGAGELNRRLTLEAPLEVEDGAGGFTRTYAAVSTLWAKVTPGADSLDVAAGSLGATLRCRIIIRMRPGITLRHRFRDGAAIYRFRAVRPSPDRRCLEIDAETRQD